MKTSIVRLHDSIAESYTYIGLCDITYALWQKFEFEFKGFMICMKFFSDIYNLAHHYYYYYYTRFKHVKSFTKVKNLKCESGRNGFRRDFTLRYSGFGATKGHGSAGESTNSCRGSDAGRLRSEVTAGKTAETSSEVTVPDGVDDWIE